ncbi:MAG: alpha-glucuronidase family glycosyl hydrolase, partial [Bryobacteraceae bacterium]
MLWIGLTCWKAAAEDGYDAWLRYAPIRAPAMRQLYDGLPAAVFVAGRNEVLDSAREELIRGLRSMLGRALRVEESLPAEPAIVLAAGEALPGMTALARAAAGLDPEGFQITWIAHQGRRHLAIVSPTERGVLYGVFTLLRHVALHRPIEGLHLREAPYARVRWVNHWDNLDGTIERGYGGRSLFFEGGRVREDLTAVRDYARLLASLGINGCSINNVNADARVITAEFLPQLRRIAAIFRAWGIRMALAIDFSSPRRIGGL